MKEVEHVMQAMQALALANEIRMARADDKRRIKRRELDPKVVIERTPSYWQEAPVIDLLLAIHKVGRETAMKVLRRERISPTRPVGALTPRQRRVLAEAVDDWTVRRAGVRRRLRAREADA